MSSRIKILIVDDESAIRETMAEIVSEYYQTLLASNGAEAIRVAEEKSPQVIILDLLMPGMNGIETCRALRTNPKTRNIRIIMLTALNDPKQRINAFSAGADDFIAKPFNPEELISRIGSKVRRVTEETSPSSQGRLSPNALSLLDYERQRLRINGKTIPLSALEFKIMAALYAKLESIVEKRELIDFAWETTSSGEKVLAPHINSLRKKLKGSNFDLKTIYGVGYSLQKKHKAPG